MSENPTVRPLLLSLFVPAVLAAQGKTINVVVTDSLGNRVAFAWVQSKSGAPRAADDSGRVTIDAVPADSVPVSVRRIGYAPFEGKVGRDAGLDAYRVLMTPLPQTLERLSIIAPRENRLYRNGFYTRQADADKISTPSRFFSPEALDARAAARATNLLDGIAFVRVQLLEGKRVVEGRGGCPANILLDGRVPANMVEEILTTEGQREVGNSVRFMPSTMSDGQKWAAARRTFMQGRQSLDDLISPGAIAAIEVYGSANQAPVEFRSVVRDQTCVLVAIWTGPRQ